MAQSTEQNMVESPLNVVALYPGGMVHRQSLDWHCRPLIKRMVFVSNSTLVDLPRNMLDQLAVNVLLTECKTFRGQVIPGDVLSVALRADAVHNIQHKREISVAIAELTVLFACHVS